MKIIETQMMHRKLVTLILLLMVGMSNAGIASGETLRLLTWNLENLNSVPGKQLFEGRSFARTERDYIAIKKYILKAQPDIILLQEIANPDALAAILPSDYQYTIAADFYRQPRQVRDIFSAIAYRAGRLKLTGVSGLPTDLQYQSGKEILRTRESAGARFQLGQVSLWVFSAHLKSSCARKTVATSGRPNSACVLLKSQLDAMARALPEFAHASSLMIVGGDFNRRGDPAFETDPYLTILPASLGGMSRRFMAPDSRKCPTFSGKDKHPIDFFVVYGKSEIGEFNAEEIVFDPRDMAAGYKFSDHCPVILDMNLLN
jgi:endonuclease/exonuclease/phosphatase family metal-dependent hydrolase